MLLALCTLAVSQYQTARKGALLYAEYFSPVPPGGYGAQRVLTAVATDTDASILRQGISDHQEGRYDYALTAFRAYLESNPEPEEYTIELLAATAAMASGEYAEGRIYLEAMPKEAPVAKAAFVYYQALLELRNEELEEAGKNLELLKGLQAGGLFPAAEILDELK